MPTAAATRIPSPSERSYRRSGRTAGSCGAAAPFVFFAGTARAGIVSTDAWTLVANRFSLFFLASGKSRFISLGESNPAAALATASVEQLLFDRSSDLNLKIEQVANGIGENTI